MLSVEAVGEADNTLRDLHNSSQDTQPHSLIVKYSYLRGWKRASNTAKIIQALNATF